MGELSPRRSARPARGPASTVNGAGNLPTGGGHGAVDLRPSPLAVFGRHPILVSLAAILCGLAAYLVSKATEPRYEATARLFLVDPNTRLELDFARTSYVDPRRNARTRADIVLSEPVLRRAADGLGDSVESVRERVDAVPSRESDVVTLTATGKTAEEAALLVRLVQQAYREVTVARQIAPYDRAAADLRSLELEIEERLHNVRVGLAARPDAPRLLEDRALLRAYLRTIRNREAALRSNASLLGTGVQLFEPPAVPEAPVSPRPLRSALIAALFGAVAAVGLLWWRDGRNPRVADPDAATEALDAQLVADLRSSLPWRSLRRGRGGREEGYRRLTFTMDALVRDGARVIFVTAADPSDLQVTVALRAAAGLATVSHRIAVVDGDRHGRQVSRYLGATSVPGLSDIEGDHVDPTALLIFRRIGGSPPIAVLPLGRRAEQLRTLEGTRAYRAALKALAAQFDATIANGPALESLAEASPASLPDVQALIVCGPKTPVRALRDLRGRLDSLGLTTAGFVFERSSPLERRIRRARLAGRRSGGRRRSARGTQR
jgi:polysaccharide biosynthesis transport protein